MNDRVHLLIWLWRLKITYFILWYHHLLLFHIWSSSWVKVWNYELVLPAGPKALNSSCGESHVNQIDHIPPCMFKDFQKRVRILLYKKSKYIVFQPWLWVTKEKKKKVGLVSSKLWFSPIIKYLKEKENQIYRLNLNFCFWFRTLYHNPRKDEGSVPHRPCLPYLILFFFQTYVLNR